MMNWSIMATAVSPNRATYAVYLPKGGKVTIHLLSHRYEAAWFNAITGEWTALAPIEGSSWTSPKAPSANDWVLLIRRV
jgi:hypothetical protein